MKHTIDNFDDIRKHLRFDKPGDIYVAHVMIRGKDINSEQKKILREDHQSGILVKTYYIDSLEYFDRKRSTMIGLAIQNNARVYIAMTRKNRLACNRIILKKLVDRVNDPNIRYDRFIRTSVCGCHISDYKWWLLDVDQDTEIQLRSGEYGEYFFRNAKLIDFKDEIVRQITRLVDQTKTRSGSEIFTVPTKNGYHIMTPPFNQSEDILVKNGGSEAVSKNDEYGDDGIEAFELGNNLKTDAMTLAYFQWEDGKIQQDKEIEEQQ